MRKLATIGHDLSQTFAREGGRPVIITTGNGDTALSRVSDDNLAVVRKSDGEVNVVYAYEGP